MLKFGTSGIRDLTDNLIKNKVATLLAEKLNSLGWMELNIGRDGRNLSDKLLSEFKESFKGEINDFGITTTPEMASKSGLSVIITASHNPCEYCGFKLFLNGKEQSSAEIVPLGKYNKWEQFPKDIIVDCANGALGYKLKELGYKNIINTEGEINKDCGVTHPNNLLNYCKDNNLDIGFAVDGDADRILLFLGNKILDGDELGFLLASLLKINRIVIDETMNSEFTNHFEVIRCKVGGQAVISSMNNENISFGAEKSGHYYFDKNIGASDSVDAIILLSNAYKEKGSKGLLEILSYFKPYYQFNKNINIQDLPTNFEEILTTTKLDKDIRTVIRKSGTEPLLRIMLEGKTKESVDNAFKILANKLAL